MNETPLYTGTLEQARKDDEVKLWRESFKANVECKIAIESAVRRGFDGMHLASGCAASVLEEFGAERVKYVLSATLQDKDYDGRFSRSNKSWGKKTEVAYNLANYEFVVDSHPAVLDGFIDQFRAECHQREMDHSFVPMAMTM